MGSLLLPPGLPEENENIPPLPALGRSMRQEFLFKPDFIQLNHGANGTYPKSVQAAFQAYQLRSEQNADLWFNLQARPALNKVRRELAAYLHADAEDLVMVPSTTAAMNAVFRSMNFSAGESILHFNTTHAGVKAVIQYISDSHKGAVTLLEFQVNYPITNPEIVENLVQFVDAHNATNTPIKVAVIDHISSIPAVLLPINDIIPVLKARNIIVVVDGAHAIGQVPIDLGQLQPDFYISNCHKWLFVARGTTVFYVDKAHQPTTHPALISANYAVPARFQDEFFRTGTKDFSAYLTVSDALAFRRRLGEDTIRSYTHQLAVEGGQLLANRLGTRVLQREEQTANMIDVVLPLDDPNDTTLTRDFLDMSLIHRFGFYAQPHKFNGEWWIRASAQIYNDLSDFEVAANALVTICQELNSKSPVKLFKNLKVFT